MAAPQLFDLPELDRWAVCPHPTVGASAFAPRLFHRHDDAERWNEQPCWPYVVPIRRLSEFSGVTEGQAGEDGAANFFLGLLKNYLLSRNSKNIRLASEIAIEGGKIECFEILRVAKAAADYCKERARLTRKQLRTLDQLAISQAPGTTSRDR